jgi:very-short-patch-repair endonuclease
MNRHARRQKQTVARQLRQHATTEEHLLWEQLRTNKLGGVHFRRQHVIQGFIVDFYCADAKLVIELDGAHHLKQQDADREREVVLRRQGNSVLRFPNEMIRSDIAAVLRTIRMVISDRTRPSLPSP